MGYRKGTLFLGLYIIMMVLVELLVFNRQYIFQSFSNLEQQHLPVESGTLHELSYENGTLIAQGTDSRIIFEDLDIEIRSILIDCQNTKFGASGQVFYQSSDQPFNAANSIWYVYARVSGYQNTLFLPETQFVSDLRIDITNIDDDILTCQDFVVNPHPKFYLSIARLTLYMGLLALGLFEFSQGITLPQRAALRNPFSTSSLPGWTEGISRRIFKDKFLFLPLTWLLLWLLPWAVWLDALPWLRSGLSLILFLTPGIVLSFLLAGVRFSLPGHFASGWALSVFWVGTLGFIGRIFHWPFDYVRFLFGFSGLIGLLALIKYRAAGRPLYKHAGFSGRIPILLLFMIIFGIIANFQSRHSGDDLSYLAYLTSWQHAQQLDFREVNFGTGAADSIRFWWGMFPMSLALLAEISHIQGLLLVGFYLEPFLVAFALIAIYALYEDLLPSQDQATIALLLHFIFLFMLRGVFQSGYMFFERLSDDKVFAAFILAPVFFMATRYFLDSFHWRSGLFFALTGLSLALTHPIILAYSVFIAGIHAAIKTMQKREYSRLVVTGVLLVLILAPSAALRFIDEAWVSRSILGLEPGLAMSDTFNLDTARESPNIQDLISYMEGTPFYGFNLARVRIAPNGVPENPLLSFLSWSYVLILGIGFLWSLFNLRKNAAAPFIAAASVLVLLCAIPYTGWLMGYFVSARMLWRVPWLLPIGLIAFTLLREVVSVIESRILPTRFRSRLGTKDILYAWVPVACLILVACFSEFVYDHYQWMATREQLNDYRNSLNRLSRLGIYIENEIEQESRFIAPLELMNYLPGLSSKSKVVLLRNAAWAPYPVDVNEIAGIFASDVGVSMEQRVQVLDKYNVQYILTEDSTLKDYYARNLKLFSTQYINGYWLVKFKG